jgi:cytochrome P450
MVVAISSTGTHKASVLDTMAVLRDVVLPTFGKGIFLRRPSVVSLAARLDLDAKAIRRLQKLRDKYGSGPLVLGIPARWHAVVLDPADARAVLDATPDPFSPATVEKEAALAHFEPAVSLISRGVERQERRRFNEAVLETGAPIHSMIPRFLEIIRNEADLLVPPRGRELGWGQFSEVFQSVVRRIVLGDGARDDRAVTDTLAELRRAANWAFLRARKTKVLAAFQQHLRTHLARAEQGSLAAAAARTRQTADTNAVDQVTHWLFAFEAAAIATWRALALLAAHPERLAQAEEGSEQPAAQPDARLAPFRAAFMESLRLWPTTPAILRETTRETHWGHGTLPAGTSLLIFAPYFHRDDDRLPFANRFAPEIWMDGSRRDKWLLVPFSAGPAICPGHNLVPLLGAAMAQSLVLGRRLSQVGPSALDQRRPMPATLDHTSLRLSFGPRLP